MYYCSECGEIFDEPKRAKDGRGEYWGAPCYEVYGVCPECGSDEIGEARRCQACGEWISGDDEFCENCMKEAEVQTEVLIGDLVKSLDAERKDVIYLLNEILNNKEE